MTITGYRYEVAPHILQIEPYKPGKPEEELIRELGLPRVIKMASNENCLGPSPLAVRAMKEAVEKTHRYPDGSGHNLRQALSARLKVPFENIILGNGSTDLVEIVARTFLQPETNSITADQTFLMYRIATVSVNAQCIAVPLQDFRFDLNGMLHAINDQTRIIYIANPNNPSGTMFSRKDFESFLKKVPADVLVVLDEAYREYVEEADYPDGLDYLQKYPNLVLLRTFSKIYGLAGIRIGYALAAAEIIGNMNRARSPFNTNSVAQAAALAALDDQEHVRISRETNQIERAFLEEGFAARKLPYIPSVANFILIPLPDADRIYQALLPYGLIVRSMRSFNQPDGLRITVARREDNIALLEALDKVR